MTIENLPVLHHHGQVTIDNWRFCVIIDTVMSDRDVRIYTTVGLLAFPAILFYSSVGKTSGFGIFLLGFRNATGCNRCR